MSKLSFHLGALNPARARAAVDLRRIHVTVADKTKRTGNINTNFLTGLQSSMNGFTPGNPSEAFLLLIWRDALEDALDQKYFFSDKAQTTATLTAEITRFDMTGFMKFTFHVDVRYRLRDRGNGRMLWETSIQSSSQESSSEVVIVSSPIGTAPVSGRAAMNRSIRLNIAKFIVQLERDIIQGKLSRPTPPKTIQKIFNEKPHHSRQISSQ